jgi:hypothetical protein
MPAPKGYLVFKRGTALYFIKAKKFNGIPFDSIEDTPERFLQDNSDVYLNEGKIIKCIFNEALMVHLFLNQQGEQT